MPTTIPAWLQRPVVPADLINSAPNLSRIQGNFAADGSAIPIVYGPFQIGGRPFAAYYNSNSAIWTVGYLLCLGPIHEIQWIFADGTYLVPGVGWNDYLGTTTQTVDPLLAAAITGYNDTLVIPASPDGTPAMGIAYVVLQFSTTQYPAWPNVVVQGFGREGFNPLAPTAADALLQYPAQYLYDFLARVMREPVDLASAQACVSANAAAGVMNLGPRRSGGFIVDKARPPAEWIELLRNAAGCWVFKRGRTWVMVPDAVRPADKALTKRDFVRGSFKPYLADSALVPTVVNVVHTVIGAAPLWYEEMTTSADAGVAAGTVPPLESTIKAAHIQHFNQASWEAQERRKKLGLGLTFEGEVVDDNCAIEAGDVVSITHSKLDQARSFRITEARLVGRGRKRLLGVEYDPAAYSLVAGSDYAVSGGGTGVIGVIEVIGATGGTLTVLNAGFESGGTSWTISGGFTISNDPTNARTGSFVCKATTPAANTVLNAARYQLKAGSRVTWGGWFKTSAGFASGSVGVLVYWLDASGSAVITAEYPNGLDGVTLDVESTTYVERRKTAIAPIGAVQGALAVYTNGVGAGSIYADDAFASVQL